MIILVNRFFAYLLGALCVSSVLVYFKCIVVCIGKRIHKSTIRGFNRKYKKLQNDCIKYQKIKFQIKYL